MPDKLIINDAGVVLQEETMDDALVFTDDGIMLVTDDTPPPPAVPVWFVINFL